MRKEKEGSLAQSPLGGFGGRCSEPRTKKMLNLGVTFGEWITYNEKLIFTGAKKFRKISKTNFVRPCTCAPKRKIHQLVLCVLFLTHRIFCVLALYCCFIIDKWVNSGPRNYVDTEWIHQQLIQNVECHDVNSGKR